MIRQKSEQGRRSALLVRKLDPEREVAEGDDGVLRMPGTLATDTDTVSHYLPGVGRARVKLRVNKALIGKWRSQGITRIPLLRDHGGWLGASTDDVLGWVDGFSVNESGGVDAVWNFDPDLARDKNGNSLFGPIKRKTLDSVSVAFAIDKIRLVEEAADGRLPLYEAVEWRAVEGSLVWMGADPGAKLRQENNMDEEQLNDMLQKAAQAGAEAAIRSIRAQDPPAPAPAPEPEPVREDPHAKIMEIARRDLGDAVADELCVRANGVAAVLGELVKSAIARKAAPASVPPSNSITGGQERSFAAYGDMVTILMARSLQGDADPDGLRAKAAKISPYWRQMTVVAAARMAAKNGCSGMRADAIDHKPAVDFLKDFARESKWRQLSEFEFIGGSRYVRMQEGLVPADLPSAYQDVMHKMLMGGYDRERDNLPLDQIAVRKDVEDFRSHKVIEMDLEGQFRELVNEERFRPLALREAEHEFFVKQYGFIIKLSFRSLVNDDLDALVQVPRLAGMWVVAGENRVFAEAVQNGTRADGTSVYSTADGTLQEVADIFAYATNWEAVWKAAVAKEVISATAGHDPKQHTVRTQALSPDVLLYGTDHEFPLTNFFDQRTGSGDKFADPADEVRHGFLRRLWNNRRLSLYLDATTQILYPGPASGVCPVMYGRLMGDGGPTTEIGDTDFNEFPGIQMSIRSTFNAIVDRRERAYKIVVQP